MKSRLLVVAAALLLVAGSFVVGRVLRGRPSAPPVERNETPEAQTRPIATAPNANRPRERPKTVKLVQQKPVLNLEDDDEDSNRTPEERKLAADIEKALEDEDFELAKRCAPAALRCGDAEIRQAMVDTLGWFGEKALPELTPFMADADEDVAESAMNEWDSAVSSIEDDAEKLGAVELAMAVVSNEDFLESISGEYIGTDEKLAVESLLRVIEGGGARGIAQAKETYEFVTGDEFTSRAAAEKWIAEEYVPPESADE